MAIAWSRISSKVIAHPPYADEAYRRPRGHWSSRADALIPYRGDKRKQEALERARHRDNAVLTDARRHVLQTLGQTVTPKDPHSAKDLPMSPTTRYANKQA